MTQVSTVSRPLADRLWPSAPKASGLVRNAVLVLAGTAVLWASAKVQVPFWPVPATMQTLAVVLIGAFYGSRLGLATIAAYLAEGAAGLPVFAGTPLKGIGLAYMTGPTGGYLAGYLFAAFAVGFLFERFVGRSAVKAGFAFFTGAVILYAFGLGWLTHFYAVVLPAMKGIPAPSLVDAFVLSFTGGMLPFLLADGVKILLATAIAKATWR